MNNPDHNPNHIDLTAELIATRISNEGDISFKDAMKIVRQIAREVKAALLRGETVELDGLGTLSVQFIQRAAAVPDPEAALVQNSKTVYRPFKQGEWRAIPTIVVDTDPQLAAVIKPMSDAAFAPGTVRPYYSTKLTEAQCEEVRRMVEAGELSVTEIAKRFGINRKTLWKIRRAGKQPTTKEGDSDDE